jgi:6-phosphogluconate dehydrogenase
MDLPVAIPSIDMAVSMRDLSVYKEMRTKAAKIYKPQVEKINISKEVLTDLENALLFCFTVAYAQGLGMLAKASEVYSMNIPLPNVIRVWKAGCIIRSALLGNFEKAFVKENVLSNILLDSEIAAMMKNREASCRKILTLGIKSGIPVTCMSSALGYYDALLSERLPINLVQAQRDYFGAHTYRRIDREGVFHTEWNVDSKEYN